MDAKIIDIGIESNTNDNNSNENGKSTKLSHLNDNFSILLSLFVQKIQNVV